MRKSKISLVEIAQKHGLSTATAYRVLKSSSRRLRVRYADFIDMARAAGFINEEEDCLGKMIVVSCGQTQHTSLIMNELESVIAADGGWHVNCGLDTLSATLERNPDAVGIIAIGEIGRILRIPVVSINCNPLLYPHSVIGCDEIAGVYKLLKHFKDMGHRRIGMFHDLLSNPSDSGRDIRRSCFPAVCRALGLEVRSEYIFQAVFSWDSYRGVIEEAVEYYMGLEERPTALLASTDIFAAAFIDGFRNAGLRLPEDMSIAGFDSYELGEFVTPRLTTIRKPFTRMAGMAVELLQRNIAGQEVGPVKILVEPELVLRDSVALASQ